MHNVEKIKSILKRIWLPLGAVAAIGLSAALLLGGIRVSRNARGNQTVLLESAAAQTSSAEVTPAPAATEALAPRERADPFAEQHGFSAVDVIDENSSSPTVNDIDYQYAASLAADMIKTVFGDDLQGETLYSHYYKYEGMVGGAYEVFAGSVDYQKARYTCYMDSTTGQIRFVDKLTPESELTKGDTFADVDRSLMDAAQRDVERIVGSVSPLIEKSFANGRRIEEVMLDGIQWDFLDPANDVLVDCKIRMSEGECYMARVTYPDIRIVQFNIYPLGWESCLWGYWDPEQADEYPPVAVQESAVEAARETPAPSPAPVPLPTPAPVPTPGR